MATKKKKEVVATRAPFEIADQIGDVRKQMASLKELDTKLTAEFKAACHQRQIKEAGNYQLSTTRALKVKDEKKAFVWASDKNCLKIDTAKAKEILRHTFDDPSKFGFAVVESESVRPKGKDIDEE